MVPSSLKAGAGRCRTVAREASDAAGRIGALPSPEGMPGEATAQLHAAAAQLHRIQASAAREAQFLTARAQLGILADGPFGGGLGGLLGLGLLSPWPPPPPVKKPKEHHWYDGPLDFLDGAKDEGVDTVRALGDTAIAVGGHALDGDLLPLGVGALLHHAGVPRVSDHVPFVAGRRQQLDTALDWAVHHPKQFAKAVGNDLVAAEDHNKGDHAHGAGRNAVGLLSLLAPVGWAGKAGVGAHAAAKGEQAAVAVSDAARAAARTARDVEKVAAGDAEGLGKIPRAADMAKLAAARARRTHWLATKAEGEARLAAARIEGETQKAELAAERAREKLSEVPRETLEKVGDAGRDGTARVLDHHGHEEHAEHPKQPEHHP
ncbi:MAG: hypothetical protein QOD69_1468 [Solirubrobacteraceae bacterium]|jgi:hypothetical protein|nr:hypothetical protein [Solirubrobacteraceae bacterium]